MIYLDDLMNQPDFNTALDRLIPEYKERFQLPGVYQLGLAVADVEKAALYLEEKGLPPFFIAAGSPASWMELGEHRSYSGKMGVSHYQGVELELLEPGQGSDVFQHSLDPADRIVAHHLAYLVDDVEPWIDTFIAAGFNVWIQGTNKIGPARSQFIYMDTREQTGVVIEFFARKCCGLNWWPLDTVYRVMARFQKWTGNRCLSTYCIVSGILLMWHSYPYI